MSRPNYLFNRSNISDVINGHQQALIDEIGNLGANQLLNTSIDDLCQYYIKKSTFTPPTLLPNQTVADQEEVDIDISQDPMRNVRDRSQPVYLKGTRIMFIIPFEGDALLFQICPSTSHVGSRPFGKVKDNTLILSTQGLDLTSEQARQKLDQNMQEVQTYLEWLRKDCDAFNNTIEQTARSQLETRRDKLLKDQNLIANIGFPLKERPEKVKTYAAPEIRQKIALIMPRPSREPFQPEPMLTDKHYNHILKVLKDMTVVMERNPSTFSHINEEALRDHFLVQLNGHFEGAATGETFNHSGKTDILIRSENKNIFIGECKFWNGPKAYLNTIDQILGYTSWRDTKVAILVFNRNKGFSKVLETIKAETPNHSNHKRMIKEVSKTEIQYQFGHNGDTNRELILTVLAFEIPS